MITRINAKLRRLRRFMSRSEWSVRLLGLTRSTEAATGPGLVLIQIDGFSQNELIKALKKKEMPFARRLIKQEGYHIRSMYSGLPSNTPAFQGELFYGVKGGVPAFNFLNAKTGKEMRMYEPNAVREIEARLSHQGEGLLKGGSSYSNIYTGGAAEPRWCAASLGWNELDTWPRPGILALLLIINAYSFVRALFYSGLEVLLAAVDAVRGLLHGEDLLKELKFIPTRVGICILLREWATIAAKIDVARGMPIIHLNLVGYDEQAHRRGPDSAFAHWVLKGIDNAVERVWKAAKGSHDRDYEVWIYSDHGQEKSMAYTTLTGSNLKETVRALWAKRQPEPDRAGGGRGVQSLRIRFLGGKRWQKLFPIFDLSQDESPRQKGPEPTVTNMGPLAMVYLGPKAEMETKSALAEKLVTQAQVPMAFLLDGNRLLAFTSEGRFDVERDSDKLFASHPFGRELAEDLSRVCQHPEAGDLVLSGWKAGRPYVSFAVENGAHGGLGPSETHAFTLLPRDVPLYCESGRHLRGLDLRHAALDLLGRNHNGREAASVRPRPAKEKHLRVMTYNIHSCIGMDGRHAPERIARLIAQHQPDIVALQEVDVARSRTGNIDQARAIARHLRMEFHFHAVRRVEDELFGNAILTHLPLKVVRAGGLPGLPGERRAESRGALWVELEVDGAPIQFLTTHLGLWPQERLGQVEALLGKKWLGHPKCEGNVILCGDFNAGPGSPTYKMLCGRFRDCQNELEGVKPKNTWFGRFPYIRLDHIFVSGNLEITDIEVPDSQLAITASDHLPLIADFKWIDRDTRKSRERLETTEA